jgi:hypothetical protein
MERKYSNPEEALNVAKEAVYLAWIACGGTSGMGAFQDRGPIQEREKVWDHAYNERDYAGGHKGQSGSINCDYVMGRMMKLRFVVDGDALKNISDSTPRGDYQSWCFKYKTYAALFDAAEANVLKKAA